MKNNKLLIVLILLLQGICCAGFAQTDNPCRPKEPQEKPKAIPPKKDKNPIDIVKILSLIPFDPNEIIGLDGYDATGSADTFRWVSATQSLAYTVYFENDADLAMAAARKVSVTVPLHEKLNFATFGVGNFGFGSHIFEVEGSPSSYQTRIDLRDSLGIFVDVVAGIDIVHNEAFWIFQSIDPATGLPPTAINMGFLPINDSLHSGEGFVSFTIKPKEGQCVTGDTVTATASIVFDVNEAIPTNTWVNTIDAFAPTSTLTITPNAAGDMLAATFAGEDDEGGCGIKQYKLYYSVNGSSYQLYDVYPVGDTAEIPVETGMEYEFFTLAEDNVGNCEPMKTQPEYNIGTNFVTLAVNAFPQEAGTVTGAGTYSVNDTAVLSATASEGYHFVNWMSQGVPVSSQTPYAVGVTQNQTFTAFFERNAYTLQTLAAAGSTITVTDLNGNEVPSGSTVLHADKLIVQMAHEQCYDIIGGLANGLAFTSGDTLTVTSDLAISTQTTPLFNTIDTSAVACDSFTWNDSTYTESGDYMYYRTNVAGCDSVVTLHLTVADAPALQAIAGEEELCLNQFATYSYDISDPNYHYRWFKDSEIWAIDVPTVTLHELNEGVVTLTMQVADEQFGCDADTSLLVQVVNHIAPDTTEILRLVNTNILVCQPVNSDYGEVHYRWGYTNRYTMSEMVMSGDQTYCLYDFGIDTLSYLYWVETYLGSPIGEGCDNRSYYSHGYTTVTSEYDANAVEAYLSDNCIVLYVNALSVDNVTAALYDVNGKLLIAKEYGATDVVSAVIPVSVAPGIYFLRVGVGSQFYSFKLLKL